MIESYNKVKRSFEVILGKRVNLSQDLPSTAASNCSQSTSLGPTAPLLLQRDIRRSCKGSLKVTSSEVAPNRWYNETPDRSRLNKWHRSHCNKRQEICILRRRRQTRVGSFSSKMQNTTKTFSNEWAAVRMVLRAKPSPYLVWSSRKIKW